ncbi:MAG: GvpL/GvpF family gas vesicle protein [Candidatus Baltobacteraceae bacterium]
MQRKAVQLFGVVSAELAGRRFIADGKACSAVAYGNLALVIRDIDPAEWNPTDSAWMSHQASVHQRVLERAMHAGTVVPARLCTVFDHRDELDELVRSNGDRWRKALARLAGKQEWCLHVYGGPHVASHHEPYLMRVSASATQAQPSFEGPAAEHLTALWKACSALASGSRRIEPLTNPHYILGGTFLLRRPRLRQFRAALMRYAVAARELGLTYYLDGPHPPFTFV